MLNRQFDHQVLEEIQGRWSPRAFDPERKVSDDDISALLEAARYAPSCFNEQPWMYIIANGGEEKARMVGVLNQSNQEWASKAPALLMVLARQKLAQTGKENRWHMFDAGTSWGYLSLEAQRRGLITHAMGGFSVELAREAFSIPEDVSVMAVVAVGYYGRKEDLSPRNAEREHPQPRKPIDDIIFRGRPKGADS